MTLQSKQMNQDLFLLHRNTQKNKQTNKVKEVFGINSSVLVTTYSKPLPSLRSLKQGCMGGRSEKKWEDVLVVYLLWGRRARN